jgi:AIR synthase-related protein
VPEFHDVVALASALGESLGIQLKQLIQVPAACLDHAPTLGGGSAPIRVGDDAAAIPDGDGHLLLAAEGMRGAFVRDDPWFAGWSAVMANVSDIASMGGTSLAVVDVYWHNATSSPKDVFAGLRAAADAFGVPVVGGHTGFQSDGPEALAVAIVGRTRHSPLTSFGARPGHVILAAIDLRGSYRGSQPFWNAATGADPARLRADLAILPEVARGEHASACKDISMGGLVGTLLMLLEASGCGADMDPALVPRPEGIDLLRWLQTFPSFGFLFAAEPEHAAGLEALFTNRGIDCSVIGTLNDSSQLTLSSDGNSAAVWDLGERPLTGFTAHEPAR